tara:strand:- start:114 stop:365 length:252 start_codon:yes stop_codon:yes gene_type:complete
MTTINRKLIISDSLVYESIKARPIWKPMHMQPVFKDSIFIEKGSKDYSASIYEDGICLPSGSNLSVSNQNRIIDITLSLISSI